MNILEGGRGEGVCDVGRDRDGVIGRAPKTRFVASTHRNCACNTEARRCPGERLNPPSRRCPSGRVVQEGERERIHRYDREREGAFDDARALAIWIVGALVPRMLKGSRGSDTSEACSSSGGRGGVQVALAQVVRHLVMLAVDPAGVGLDRERGADVEEFAGLRPWASGSSVSREPRRPSLGCRY